MSNPNEVKITPRDKVLMAWQNSMGLVRDFETYSKQVDDRRLAGIFADFAEEEGLHASRLREILCE